MQQKIKAIKYIEYSALTQEGLNAVFNEAIGGVFQPQNISNKKAVYIVLK